jgi:hypothetical protein
LVPEHFSIPLFKGLKEGLFEEDIELIEFPKGTGKL